MKNVDGKIWKKYLIKPKTKKKNNKNKSIKTSDCNKIEE